MVARTQGPLVVGDMPAAELGPPVPAACTAPCQQFGPRLGNGLSIGRWQPGEHLSNNAASQLVAWGIMPVDFIITFMEPLELPKQALVLRLHPVVYFHDLGIAHPLKRVLFFHLHLRQNLLHSLVYIYIYIAFNGDLNRMRSRHSDPCNVISKNGAHSQCAPAFKLSSFFPPKVRPELSSAPLCDWPSSNFGPEGSLVGVYGSPC